AGAGDKGAGHPPCARGGVQAHGGCLLSATAPDRPREVFGQSSSVPIAVPMNVVRAPLGLMSTVAMSQLSGTSSQTRNWASPPGTDNGSRGEAATAGRT